MGGMIDTEMWENRMNLEIHECGNASVERELWNASEQGGKKKAKWRLAKKNGRERTKTTKKKKMKCLKKLARNGRKYSKVMNGRRVGHTRVTLMETKKK